MTRTVTVTVLDKAIRWWRPSTGARRGLRHGGPTGNHSRNLNLKFQLEVASGPGVPQLTVTGVVLCMLMPVTRLPVPAWLPVKPAPAGRRPGPSARRRPIPSYTSIYLHMIPSYDGIDWYMEVYDGYIRIMPPSSFHTWGNFLMFELEYSSGIPY